MHKQAKSNYKMQKIQPKLQQLQQKYANDNVRLTEETQKLYAEAKFNPLAGCLPMLLQMPIFVALFQTLREMGNRTELQNSDFAFYNLVPNLLETPSSAFVQGFATFVPYLVLMLIFALATFFPMIQQQLKNKDSKTRNQTLIMGVVMTLMMLWVSWSSPAGVLLFWGVSSLIGIAQNQFTLARCRKADIASENENEEVLKPVEIDVIRKEKKKRPTKKH
jgi:YidC/Oxa1 family membrane protein insertase